MLSTPILRADNEDYDLPLTDESDDNVENKDKSGHRSAPILTLCTISYNKGVTIYSDEGPVDIVSFEIWDVDDETCLGVYGNERQFLDALYSNKGEYIVVFTAINKKYKGFIWLE